MSKLLRILLHDDRRDSPSASDRVLAVTKYIDPFCAQDTIPSEVIYTHPQLKRITSCRQQQAIVDEEP